MIERAQSQLGPERKRQQKDKQHKDEASVEKRRMGQAKRHVEGVWVGVNNGDPTRPKILQGHTTFVRCWRFKTHDASSITKDEAKEAQMGGREQLTAGIVSRHLTVVTDRHRNTMTQLEGHKTQSKHRIVTFSNGTEYGRRCTEYVHFKKRKTNHSAPDS